ncbi:MAG: ISKra4 family transposase [Candidatus Binatia bacterium]
MQFKIQLHVVTEDGKTQQTEEIAVFDKSHEQLAELGLTIGEAKTLLAQLQHQIVAQQTTAYVEDHRNCKDCGKSLRRKGSYPIQFRTLFGTTTLKSPRLYQCSCQPSAATTISPLKTLLSEHTAPELLYLETKWAALMAYGLTAELLKDVLPVDATLNAETIRQHLKTVVQRDEAELGEEQCMYVDSCPAEWEALPRPDGPITVGIDGGYVRDWENEQTNFEVIVGKSLPRDAPDKYFGFVQSYDTKPKRRLFEVLKGQGLQNNQQITFLSDGGDTVRELQLYLNPHSDHLLDWFHVTMRITVLGQYIKGLKHHNPVEGKNMEETLERSKWYLWHGNLYEALLNIKDLEWDAEVLESTYPNLRKLHKALVEFHDYIENNRGFIPNYGERWRYGERISTGFVESTVNAVVSKRFAKKQQMQWSKQSAHDLLQARVRVLNDELRAKFEQWYPGFGGPESEELKLAA